MGFEIFHGGSFKITFPVRCSKCPENIYQNIQKILTYRGRESDSNENA